MQSVRINITDRLPETVTFAKNVNTNNIDGWNNYGQLQKADHLFEWFYL